MKSICVGNNCGDDLAALPWIMNRAIAGGVEHQVCVVDTDYFLDVADYREAIRRHIEALR